MGTPVKTTSIEVIDSWAVISAGTMRIGDDTSGGTDISESYSTLLYIDVAPVEAVAQVGMEITVEVSYADQFWVEYITFTSNAITASTTTLDAQATAPTTTLSVALAADSIGDRLLIKDGTIADSELVTVAATAAGEYTITDVTTATHANGTSIFGGGQQWAVEIPLAAAKVRVLYNNVDTDCDMASSTRMSIVTNLNA